LQKDRATDGIVYRLRSRKVSRLEPEPENDNVQNSASYDDSRPTPSHSYNLRARPEATQSKYYTYIPGFAVWKAAAGGGLPEPRTFDKELVLSRTQTSCYPEKVDYSSEYSFG